MPRYLGRLYYSAMSFFWPHPARNIIVETVFITDLFSPAFASQIESKVVAFQKYLTEQNNPLAVRVITNQTVVQSQAAGNIKCSENQR
jgi:hypothetical protein